MKTLLLNFNRQNFGRTVAHAANIRLDEILKRMA